MKKNHWLFLVLLIHFNSTAQLFDYAKDFNITRNYKPWGISVSANLYPFYSAGSFNGGKWVPRTYLMWGFSFGLAYNWAWSNHFGMKFRLKGEKMPVYSYKFFIEGSETADGKNFYDNLHAYAPFSVRFPVSLEYRNYTFENYTLHFQAGMDLGYHFGFNQALSPNDYLSMAFVNSPSFVYDLYFVAGWYYEFPWALWETGFVYRHTLKNYYNGTYLVQNLKTLSGQAGFLEQSGRYLGIEFTVYFKKPYVDNANCPGKVHSRKVLKRKRMLEKAREKARKAEEKAKKKEIKRNRKMKRRKKRFLLF